MQQHMCVAHSECSVNGSSSPNGHFSYQHLHFAQQSEICPDSVSSDFSYPMHVVVQSARDADMPEPFVTPSRLVMNSDEPKSRNLLTVLSSVTVLKDWLYLPSWTV